MYSVLEQAKLRFCSPPQPDKKTLLSMIVWSFVVIAELFFLLWSS